MLVLATNPTTTRTQYTYTYVCVCSYRASLQRENFFLLSREQSEVNAGIQRFRKSEHVYAYVAIPIVFYKRLHTHTHTHTHTNAHTHTYLGSESHPRRGGSLVFALVAAGTSSILGFHLQRVRLFGLVSTDEAIPSPPTFTPAFVSSKPPFLASVMPTFVFNGASKAAGFPLVSSALF